MQNIHLEFTDLTIKVFTTVEEVLNFDDGLDETYLQHCQGMCSFVEDGDARKFFLYFNLPYYQKTGFDLERFIDHEATHLTFFICGYTGIGIEEDGPNEAFVYLRDYIDLKLTQCLESEILK